MKTATRAKVCKYVFNFENMKEKFKNRKKTCLKDVNSVYNQS